MIIVSKATRHHCAGTRGKGRKW